MRLAAGTRGLVRPGDQLVFRAGPFRITFDILDAQPPRELTLDVRLPFGITNHERIQVTAIDAQTSRVTFN